MVILLILSTIEINLHSNKDTYLLGEDILIRWEIINTGMSKGYYEKGGEYGLLLSDHSKMWDINGNEVPHSRISGTTSVRKEELYKISMFEIEPGYTIKYKEVNLIGDFGNLHFAEHGIGNNFIKPDEYFFSIFYWIKENNSYQKVYSDSLHFFIIDPYGEEKLAWEIYREYKREDILAENEEKQIGYAVYILKRYPKSIYIESLLNNLTSVFRIYKREECKGDVERMRGKTRELLNYMEENIDKFSDKTLKNALWCIIKGESMLGTSQEEVKKIIIQMNVPLDNEMKEFLKINN